MNGVYNRKLFTNKSQEARNKLRDMGGVAPMAPQMGGIMASSPELMQAAMRRPVVMPATNQPMMAPASSPAPQMLPPSQPIPNISGIPQGSSPKAPAPRPMAQKPGVAKFNEGGMAPKLQAELENTVGMQDRMEKTLAMSFGKAFEFGSTAITTENPEELGLPKGARAGIKKARDELTNNPGASAQEFIAETVPKKDRTGNTKSDLRKAAAVVGIQRVPAEAEIDQLNKAIFGAKLAGAIAGNYVNPNTGQELRPTAGSRIAQAAVEGLAVSRETETRRAAQEAALAEANIRARSKSTTSKLSGADKELMDMFADRVKSGEDPADVAADFNRDIPGSGDRILTYLQSAPLGGGGASGSTPRPTSYPPGTIINQGGNRFQADQNGIPQLIQGE